MGKVPKLRFEGFEGDWEEKKLGSVFCQTAYYTNPSESGLELWSLTVEDGLTRKTERYVREFLVKKEDKFKEVRPGEIVYNPMNMTLGAVGYNDMASSVAVSGYYTTMKTVPGYNAYFINTWLKSPQAILLYKSFATGTLLEKQRVQFPTLSRIPVSFPSDREQKSIGDLFQAIDTLLTLYQRKHDALLKAKQFYLQNLFPRKGEKTPRLRFAGLEGEWEEKKLGEVIKIATRKNGGQYTKEDVLSVSDEYGCVNQIRFQGRSFAAEDISNYKVVKQGDIVYTRSPLLAKPYGIIKIVGEETGIVSPLYIVNETVAETDSKFIYYTFDSPQKTNQYLSPLVRKGAKNTMNVSNDEWLSGEIMVAPSCEEQRSIGSFLSNLDHLITVQSRKLETLKRLKQFMLQNLFV